MIFVCNDRQATKSMKYIHYVHFLLKTNKTKIQYKKKTWGGADGDENLTINFY